MQMLIKKTLLLFFCFFLHQVLSASNIELTGSLEYFLDPYTKKTIDINSVIDANQFDALLETFLVHNKWKTHKQDSQKLLVYSSEDQTRAYGINYPYTTSPQFDATYAATRYGVAGSAITDVEFHKSGKYILVSGDQANGYNSQIFALSETGSALWALPGCNQLTSASHGVARGSSWHPSGKFYAVGGGDTVYIYSFDETTLTSTLVNSILRPNDTVASVKWHNDNRLFVSPRSTYQFPTEPWRFPRILRVTFDNPDLPIGGYTSYTLNTDYGAGQLDSYNASSFVKKPTIHNPSGVVGIAMGGARSSYGTQFWYFMVFGGGSLAAGQSLGKDARAATFSPNGKYLAFSLYYNSVEYLRIYPVNSSGNRQSTVLEEIYTAPNALEWSPDSQLLTVGYISSSLGYDATVYTWDEYSATLTEVPDCRVSHGSSVYSAAWSPDGSFVAYGCDTSSSINLRVHQISRQSTGYNELMTNKNKGTMFEIDSIIKSDYQSLLETETLLYATSNSFQKFNPSFFTGDTNELSESYYSSPDYIAFSPTNKYTFLSLDSMGNNIYMATVPDLTISATLHNFVTTNTISRAASFAPNGKWFTLQKGSASNPGSRTNDLYWVSNDVSFQNMGLNAFSSYHIPAWHPNSSLLLTSNQSAIFNVLSLNYDTTYDDGYSMNTVISGLPIGGSSVIGRGEWAPDGQSFFAYNSGTGALGGYFYDFTTETPSWNQLTSAGIASTAISAIAVQPNKDTTNESCNIAVGFNGSSPNLRVYRFNGVSQTTPSITILPGCSLNEASEIRKLAWSNNGAWLAAVWHGTSQYLKLYRFIDDLLLPTSVTFSTNMTATDNLSWSADDRYLAVKAANNYSIISFDQYSYQSLLKETSDTLNALNTSIVTFNSNALVSMYPLAVQTDNAWETYKDLTDETYSSIITHLFGMSNAMQQLERTNSTAIIKYKNLAIATSNGLLSAGQLDIDNSNAIVSLVPLITANSNAINGLLRSTSNAVAGLLRSTSNAAAGLLVATSKAATAIATKAQHLDTIDAGPAHVHFSSASITMTYNLNLSTDHQLFVHASGIVNGNGHSITLARGANTQITVDAGVTTTFQNVIFKDYNDQAITLGAGSSLIFGNQSRVELSEPQTLLRTWSFAGYSQLNGLGNSLTLGTGPLFLSSLVSSSLQLSNLKLLNVRENNIRAANNNSAINFQDVTLNMAADYTYSIGSISVQNDLILRGTSTFNYTTIMGLTVNPASQLTVDQKTTFNYAPAGNFRNLLSLTDSSARLFFNNATLVATATGPRLTKGTLLVDGIMQVQSSAAASAQAIIFGNETPADDLIINILPGAGINLKTGFLNYANAN